VTFIVAATAARDASAQLQAQPQAQNNSLFGNRGPASQIGSNLRGSMVGQGTTFGTTVQPLTGQSLTGLQSGAQGDFVGRSDNSGRFVGDQRAGQQLQGAARSRLGGFGQRQQSSANEDRGRFEEGRPIPNNRQTVRMIRPRQKIAFEFPERASTAIDQSLQRRMSQVAAVDAQGADISIVVDAQGVVVLTGTVGSAEAKRLAAIMARLEPGVREVDNRLEVVGAPANE
jgi:osmotically-inducible protein OsmY